MRSTGAHSSNQEHDMDGSDLHRCRSAPAAEALTALHTVLHSGKGMSTYLMFVQAEGPPPVRFRESY